jgi:hypothetical protein
MAVALEQRKRRLGAVAVVEGERILNAKTPGRISS